MIESYNNCVNIHSYYSNLLYFQRFTRIDASVLCAILCKFLHFLYFPITNTIALRIYLVRGVKKWEERKWEGIEKWEDKRDLLFYHLYLVRRMEKLRDGKLRVCMVIVFSLYLLFSKIIFYF